MKWYPAFKKKEVQPHATVWMSLERLTLREGGHRQMFYESALMSYYSSLAQRNRK